MYQFYFKYFHCILKRFNLPNCVSYLEKKLFLNCWNSALSVIIETQNYIHEPGHNVLQLNILSKSNLQNTVKFLGDLHISMSNVCKFLLHSSEISWWLHRKSLLGNDPKLQLAEKMLKFACISLHLIWMQVKWTKISACHLNLSVSLELVIGCYQGRSMKCSYDDFR